MHLVDKDFVKIIDHWKSLARKVDRHLDVLLQFRVLEQQELAISQRHIATQQQNLAIEEAKSSRVQLRSIMIFTAITIIFLPLSLFTSYFGMNLTDITKTSHDSKYFWLIAGPVSGTVVLASFVITKCLSVVRQPPPDAEKAMTDGAPLEDETSWRSRLGLPSGKIKSS